MENISNSYRKRSPARWASWSSEYTPELLPSTNQPMGRTSGDGGHVWAAEVAAMFCRSRSPLKKGHPKQGEHTRFPDNDAFDCNVHPADARPALTDTNHGLNPLLPSSKPYMGSGPVVSPGSVSRKSRSSPDDMPPAPDANAAAEDPSNLLTPNQKKRLKKKARKAKAKLAAEEQRDSHSPLLSVCGG